jgi:hypothetical protein
MLIGLSSASGIFTDIFEGIKDFFFDFGRRYLQEFTLRDKDFDDEFGFIFMVSCDGGGKGFSIIYGYLINVIVLRVGKVGRTLGKMMIVNIER